MIDEIERYGVPLYPEDKATLSYLKAMRLLFERGFLFREHICTPDSPVLGRIKEGFSFLIDWYDGLLAHGVDPQDVNQTKFLAWQVNLYHSCSMVMCFLIKAHSTCFTIYSPPPSSLSLSLSLHTDMGLDAALVFWLQWILCRLYHHIWTTALCGTCAN